MKLVCKHGLPVTWDMKPPDWHDEDKTYRQTITVTMCRACVDEGTAAALADEIEGMMRRYRDARLDAQMRG